MHKYVVVIHCESATETLSKLATPEWADSVVLPGLEVTNVQVSAVPQRDSSGRPRRGSRGGSTGRGGSTDRRR